MGRLSDWIRELRIERLRQQFAATYDIRDRHRIWLLLHYEINSRSPGQVERMERARGLRA